MAAKGLFGKLQLKDQTDIVVLDAPPSFETALRALGGVRIHRKLGLPAIDFALAFVVKPADLVARAKALTERAVGDAVLWFAYPKGSSKRYSSDLKRDVGWEVLGDAGFEPVRMVAIDEDWSAKRYRRVAFIKSMQRDPKYAMSKAGKEKARKR